MRLDCRGLFRVGRFLVCENPKNEQATGLYVLAGLYYLICTYLYVEPVSAIVFDRDGACFSDSWVRNMELVSAMENS